MKLKISKEYLKMFADKDWLFNDPSNMTDDEFNAIVQGLVQQYIEISDTNLTHLWWSENAKVMPKYHKPSNKKEIIAELEKLGYQVFPISLPNGRTGIYVEIK